MRLYTARIGRWAERRADLIALAPAEASAASPACVLAADAEETVFHWRALPLPLRKEWAESMWANITSPQPRLFLVYRIENGLIRPALTVAGDEAAGYGEVDESVLSPPLPAWLLALVREFVAAHYRPQPKKARRRQ